MELKKYYLVVFLCLATFSSSSFAKPVLNIQHWQTPQGSKVLFVETHEVPMIDIQVTFNAGSARDQTQYGLAQFTNAMLDEGSKKYTTDQIAEKFDNLGANFYNNAAQDMAIVGLRCLTEPKIFNSAFPLFTEVLTHPIFPQHTFKRVKKQILSAIKLAEQQPGSTANHAFMRALYDNHPYAHPVIGTKASIAQLTTNDLKAFYKEYYVSPNALITLVGDISLEKARSIAQTLSNQLPQGHLPAKLTNIPKQTSSITKLIKFPSEQSNILMGQIGIAREDPNYFPLTIGNYILGAAPLTSLLFQEVRNKRGFAYSVSSRFITNKMKGPFVISVQTQSKQTKEAINIARKTLFQFIQKGPTRAQLNSAKKSLIGQFPMAIANNSKILANLTAIGFYHLPLNYLDTYQSKVESVSIKQIKRAFQDTIKPDQMVTVIVGK